MPFFYRSDLVLATFSLIVFLVNVRLFVFNKPVEQAGELAGHGGNGPWERQVAYARGHIVLPSLWLRNRDGRIAKDMVAA